jgi:ribonuclease BN (tRNA processing enzyme)
MDVTFLGTNGWYPTEKAQTSCVFVETGSDYIILDAGTGIHRITDLIKDDSKRISLLISHSHLDHLFGFFLLPDVYKRDELRAFGQKGLEDDLRLLLRNPLMKNFNDYPFKIKVREIEPGKTRRFYGFEGFSVTAGKLKHLIPIYGYRIESTEGKALAYCTDTEQTETSLELAKEADLLIHGTNFKHEDLPRNSGHSSDRQAAEVADACSAKQLALFHFHPRYSMMERRQMETNARNVFKNSFASQDKQKVCL